MRLRPLSALACLIITVVTQSGSSANPPTVPSGFTVTAGQPATLTWTPTTQGTVTLTLRSGAASDLNKGTVIASGIPNSGKYTFTLPADTTRNSDYTIEISSDTDSSAVNYTPPFVVDSSNTVESVTPSASSASATAASTVTSATSAATKSTSSTASTKSASSTSLTVTRSTTSGTTASSAATSSSTSSKPSANTQAAPAPSSGASALSVQGGVLALAMGLMVL